MKTYKHERVAVAEFDSLDDLLHTVATMTDKGTHGHEFGQPSWHGTDTMEEALTLGAEGWTGVRQEVDAILSRIADKVKDVAPLTFDMAHDVTGFAVDMAAFLSGEAECMVYPVPTASPRSTKVVRIHYNTGAQAFVDPQAMINRGVAIIALVDALNGMGVNCEVWTESACKPNSGRTLGTVLTCIKQAHEPADVNRLMFALANPAMHRRITFAARVASKLPNIEQGGDCSSIPLLMTSKVNADVTVAPSHSNKDRIAADPDAWILSELDRLGFTVND